tara:strand:+ start:5899 stop:6282 length:384 start_codon:yes stop_codon:yes gene_type:complete
MFNDSVTILESSAGKINHAIFNTYTSAEHFTEEDYHFEVYGVTEDLTNSPISGTYYQVGSGHFIIVGKDSIYSYKNNPGNGMELKRYNPLCVMMITHVKQSLNPNVDDRISYIRILDPSVPGLEPIM